MSFFLLLDDTTYDTVFQTVARNTLILRVHFPAEGNVAPIMTLAGCTATHPWIGRDMRVIGYKPIQSDQQWKDARMLLGVAVQEVVQHFQVEPPTIVEITDAGLRNIQPQFTTDSGTNSCMPPHGQSQSSSVATEDAPPDYETLLQAQSPSTPPPRQVDVPSVPAEFSKLESMDREELERLLNDHIALVSFCNQLPFIRELNEKRVSVLEENIAKAKQNMEKEQELKSLYSEVQDLQKQLMAWVDEFKKLEAKQDSLCAVLDIGVALRELHSAKKKSYEESEQLAEEWIDDGAENVKDFCRRFIEARKVHHIQAGKMEVLQRQERP
jgi:ESCRT-I complex subunit VPS37